MGGILDSFRDDFVMNEFTKEELQYLHSTMISIIEVYPEISLPYDIREKLHHLIETYNTPQAIRERNEQHGGCF